jgi:hypothetical protein
MFDQIQNPEELMAAYNAGPEQLEEALKGLSETQLDLSRTDGKWTIRQIVHHIVDAEDFWETIIKAALGNTGCTYDISWYIPDNICAGPLDYAHRPIRKAVQLFNAQRGFVADMVTHLPNAGERRVRVTPLSAEYKDKIFTLNEMLNWQILHLDIHIKQILETREVHGV